MGEILHVTIKLNLMINPVLLFIVLIINIFVVKVDSGMSSIFFIYPTKIIISILNSGLCPKFWSLSSY